MIASSWVGWDCCNVGNPTGQGCLYGHCGDYAFNVFSSPDEVDPVWGKPLVHTFQFFVNLMESD